jgi:hypothetical protein
MNNSLENELVFIRYGEPWIMAHYFEFLGEAIDNQKTEWKSSEKKTSLADWQRDIKPQPGANDVELKHKNK